MNIKNYGGNKEIHERCFALKMFNIASIHENHIKLDYYNINKKIITYILLVCF